MAGRPDGTDGYGAEGLGDGEPDGPDRPDGAGEGAGDGLDESDGLGDGDGAGHCHRGGAGAAAVVVDGDGDGLGDASQLTGTEVEPGLMYTVAPPLAPACLLTDTTMVTLWPALSCPDASLRVTSADEVLAAQLTVPPLAVSMIWPCEPVPRLRLAGLTWR